MHKFIHPKNVDAKSYIHKFINPIHTSYKCTSYKCTKRFIDPIKKRTPAHFLIPTKEHLHKLVVERPRGVSDHNAHGTARRRISLRAQPVRNSTESVETDVRSYAPVVSFDH